MSFSEGKKRWPHDKCRAHKRTDGSIKENDNENAPLQQWLKWEMLIGLRILVQHFCLKRLVDIRPQSSEANLRNKIAKSDLHHSMLHCPNIWWHWNNCFLSVFLCVHCIKSRTFEISLNFSKIIGDHHLKFIFAFSAQLISPFINLKSWQAKKGDYFYIYLSKILS